MPRMHGLKGSMVLIERFAIFWIGCVGALCSTSWLTSSAGDWQIDKQKKHLPELNLINAFFYFKLLD